MWFCPHLFCAFVVGFEFARWNEVVLQCVRFLLVSLQVCGNASSAVIGRDVYNRDQDRSETRYVRFAGLVAIERDRYSGRGSGCVMQGQALGNVETLGLEVSPNLSANRERIGNICLVCGDLDYMTFDKTSFGKVQFCNMSRAQAKRHRMSEMFSCCNICLVRCGGVIS